jgi:hypothetical protein
MTPLWDVDVDGIEVDMEYGISTICMEPTPDDVMHQR